MHSPPQPPCALLPQDPVIPRAGPENLLAPCHPNRVLLGPFHSPCYRGKQGVFWEDPSRGVKAGVGDTLAPRAGEGGTELGRARHLEMMWCRI